MDPHQRVLLEEAASLVDLDSGTRDTAVAVSSRVAYLLTAYGMTGTNVFFDTILYRSELPS